MLLFILQLGLTCLDRVVQPIWSKSRTSSIKPRTSTSSCDPNRPLNKLNQVGLVFFPPRIPHLSLLPLLTNLASCHSSSLRSTSSPSRSILPTFRVFPTSRPSATAYFPDHAPTTSLQLARSSARSTSGSAGRAAFRSSLGGVLRFAGSGYGSNSARRTEFGIPQSASGSHGLQLFVLGRIV
jgi:hypothetical protein